MFVTCSSSTVTVLRVAGLFVFWYETQTDTIILSSCRKLLSETLLFPKNCTLQEHVSGNWKQRNSWLSLCFQCFNSHCWFHLRVYIVCLPWRTVHMHPEKLQTSRKWCVDPSLFRHWARRLETKKHATRSIEAQWKPETFRHQIPDSGSCVSFIPSHFIINE